MAQLSLGHPGQPEEPAGSGSGLLAHGCITWPEGHGVPIPDTGWGSGRFVLLGVAAGTTVGFLFSFTFMFTLCKRQRQIHSPSAHNKQGWRKPGTQIGPPHGWEGPKHPGRGHPPRRATSAGSWMGSGGGSPEPRPTCTGCRRPQLGLRPLPTPALLLRFSGTWAV